MNVKATDGRAGGVCEDHGQSALLCGWLTGKNLDLLPFITIQKIEPRIYQAKLRPALETDGGELCVNAINTGQWRPVTLRVSLHHAR